MKKFINIIIKTDIKDDKTNIEFINSFLLESDSKRYNFYANYYLEEDKKLKKIDNEKTNDTYGKIIFDDEIIKKEAISPDALIYLIDSPKTNLDINNGTYLVLVNMTKDENITKNFKNKPSTIVIFNNYQKRLKICKNLEEVCENFEEVFLDKINKEIIKMYENDNLSKVQKKILEIFSITTINNLETDMILNIFGLIDDYDLEILVDKGYLEKNDFGYEINLALADYICERERVKNKDCAFAYLYENFGDLYDLKKESVEAIKAYQKAIDIFKELAKNKYEYNQNLIAIYLKLIFIGQTINDDNFVLTNLDQAFNVALEVVEKYGSDYSFRNEFKKLGYLYIKYDNYENALKAFKISLDIFYNNSKDKNLDDYETFNFIEDCKTIAQLCQDLQKIDEAIAYCEKAVEFGLNFYYRVWDNEEYSDEQKTDFYWDDLLDMVIYLGDLYLNYQDDATSASINYETALDLYKSYGYNSRDRADILRKIGYANYLCADFECAIWELNDAIKNYQAIGKMTDEDEINLAKTYLLLGKSYLSLKVERKEQAKNNQKALDALEEALLIYQKKDPDKVVLDFIDVNLSLANLKYQLKKYQDAVKHYDKAYEMVQNIPEDVIDNDKHFRETLINSYEQAAPAYGKAGQNDNLIKCLETYIDQFEKYNENANIKVCFFNYIIGQLCKHEDKFELAKKHSKKL